MCYVLKIVQDEELLLGLDRLFHHYFVNVIMLPNASSLAEVLARPLKHEPEILLIEMNQEETTFEKTALLKERYPNVRFIMIDQEENFENIQQAMRMGAIDYLVTPLVEEEALTSIHRAIISLNQVSLLHHRNEAIDMTHNETILPMIEYIHEHFSRDLNLDELANYMHLNPSYLCQLFKKEVGMTYIAYLTQYRVEQAKKRLRETPCSLADISEEVGYGDPAYFSRIFKKLAGISPNQYRQRFKGDYVGTTYLVHS